MFVLSNFLQSFAIILSAVLNVLSWLIIIRALISWVSPDPFNPIVQFLDRMTEPILSPIRRLIPFSMAIDISPIIAILLIWFLRMFLVGTIIDFAMKLK